MPRPELSNLGLVPGVLEPKNEPSVERITIIAPLPNKDSASNGISRFIHFIASGIVERGIVVDVLSQRGAFDVPSAAYEQITTWHPSQRALFDIFMMLLRRKSKFVNLHHEVFLFGKLRTNAYLLVFLLAARLRGMRIVTTMHHALDVASIRQAISADEHSHRALTPVFALASHLFNGFVALLSYRVSVHKKESLEAFHPWVRRRVAVIPLVIEREDVDARDIDRVREKYALPERFVLAFGFISRYKGIEQLLDAYAFHYPSTPLVIVGSRNVRLSRQEDYGRYYDALRTRAEKLGLHWLEYIPEADVGPMFEAASAAVMSYTHHHAVSGPLSIAAAHGTPSIVSRVLALEEFVGLDCVPSAPEIAKAIARLDADPKYVEDLRGAVFTYAALRSTKAVASAYVRLFD